MKGRKTLQNKKVILWDFDGVLMDSMPIRNKGFELVLKEFPHNEVRRLMDFHLENGGLSRYVKFRYFFENIRGEEIDEVKVRRWAEKFSCVMRRELVAPKLLIQDSLSFVKEKYNKYMMHIVSGSDEEELRFLCKKLGIASYFKSIHGSPTSKKQLVRDIIASETYDNADCILIGDSINDFEAARENDIDFCGYNNSALSDKNYIDKFCQE